MDSPPLTLVIVDDRTMVILDELLAAMAEALETPEALTPDVIESLRKISCQARALVLEERDSGLRGWKIIQDAADEIKAANG